MFRFLDTVRHIVFHHNIARRLSAQDDIERREIRRRFHLIRPEEDTRTNRYIWKTRVLPQLRQIGRAKTLHRQRLARILRQELPIAVKAFQDKALLKQRFRRHVLEELLDTVARRKHQKRWVHVMSSVRARRWHPIDVSDYMDAIYGVFIRWVLLVAMFLYGMCCLYEYVYDRVRSVMVRLEKSIGSKKPTRRRRRSAHNTKRVCFKYRRTFFYIPKKTRRTGFGYHRKSFKGN